MFSLVQSFEMHLNLVWFRLRVSKSQRHTHTQKHSEYHSSGQAGFSEHKAGDFHMIPARLSFRYEFLPVHSLIVLYPST